MSESTSQGQGHRSNKACLCVLFAGGLPSTETQSFLSRSFKKSLDQGIESLVSRSWPTPSTQDQSNNEQQASWWISIFIGNKTRLCEKQ